MKKAYKILFAAAVLSLLVGVFGPSNASASLVGAVPLPPNTSVVPGSVTGDAAGTLLAVLSSPFSNASFSGTLNSAVYREPGGTLDFYYQVTNNLTSTDPIARTTESSFLSWATSVGFRTDGASLTAGGFVDSGLAPLGADRNPAGNVVGFVFHNSAPLSTTEIIPGTHSDVLVIVTDATTFGSGLTSIIDAQTATVLSFAPTPEPGSLLLLVTGVLGLVSMRRIRL